jgi:alpha-galactosidase
MGLKTIAAATPNHPPSANLSADVRAEIVAFPVQRAIPLDAAHPAAEWQSAAPVVFCSDWQGCNSDDSRKTAVRVLWSPDTLYLRFDCRYRDIYVFDDSVLYGRHDHLWDRDVVEVFLQSDSSQARSYKEFEVAPNGLWVDLDISSGGRADLKSGLHHSVALDAQAHTWAAELAIPMSSLTSRFDPADVWCANFFRVEGRDPRLYFAWCPTHTPQPNFHVPEAFGRLRFISK